MPYLREEGITFGNKTVRWEDVAELRLAYGKGQLGWIRYKADRLNGVIYPRQIKADLTAVLSKVDPRKVKRVELFTGKSLAGYTAVLLLLGLSLLSEKWKWLLASLMGLVYWIAVPPNELVNDRPLRVILLIFAGVVLLNGLVRYLSSIVPG